MLSKEVYIMIYGSTEGYQLLMYGSVVLIFMSLSAIQNTILQGINKLYLVLSTAFLSIIIKFVIIINNKLWKEEKIWGNIIL